MGLLIAPFTYAEAPYDSLESVISAEPQTVIGHAYIEVSTRWPDQWEEFVKIINKESGWNYLAANPSSSASGLCQTMMSLHKDTVSKNFLHDPYEQIDWCILYISKTYQDPVRAWEFHIENNWF